MDIQKSNLYLKLLFNYSCTPLPFVHLMQQTEEAGDTPC